jgi:alginate O-acetyltransferase complex protein AlgI
MDLFSLSFLSFISVALFFYHLSTSQIYREILLLISNLVFLGSFVQSPLQLIPLGGFLAIGYGLVRLQRHFQRNSVVLGCSISLIIALFIYIKKYRIIDFLPQLPFPYLFLGLSYVLFRILQLLIDTYGNSDQGQIPILRYLNFNLFFLTFISGPIQRFEDFDRQQSKPDILDDKGALLALSRIITGFVKIIFLSNLLFDCFSSYDSIWATGKFKNQLMPLVCWYQTMVVCYLFYLYFNFAGYMDVVIGISRLFGWSIPENFKRPFEADNFLDFWSRWHITLSDWFKFYLFNPVLKTLVKRWSSPTLGAYFGSFTFFVTFFVMGIWHGTTLPFLIYGLFLGFGVSVNKFFQVKIRKILGKKKYKGLCDWNPYRLICRGLTLSYFAVALTCLWMEPETMTLMFGKASAAVILVSIVCIGLIATLFCYLSDLLYSLYMKLPMALFKDVNTSFFPQYIWITVQVFLLIFVSLKSINPTPEFVYQAF